MVCLDTDILIGVLRKDKTALSAFERLRNEAELFITPISAAELFKGAYRSVDPNSINLTKDLIAVFDVLEFKLKAAENFGLLLRNLNTKGYQIADPDAFIAAICIANGETLVTRDKDFEKIEGLKTEKW